MHFGRAGSWVKTGLKATLTFQNKIGWISNPDQERRRRIYKYPLMEMIH